MTINDIQRILNEMNKGNCGADPFQAPEVKNEWKKLCSFILDHIDDMEAYNKFCELGVNLLKADREVSVLVGYASALKFILDQSESSRKG